MRALPRADENPLLFVLFALIKLFELFEFLFNDKRRAKREFGDATASVLLDEDAAAGAAADDAAPTAPTAPPAAAVGPADAAAVMLVRRDEGFEPRGLPPIKPSKSR